jgi:YgiT-type zinc finger domain-containing protein
MAADQPRTLICFRCRKALEPRKTDFTYLGHTFYADLPRCPECGQVYISEELVRSRIIQVEMNMEDK